MIVVANTVAGAVDPIDPATDKYVGGAPVGTSPAQVAVSAGGKYACTGISDPPAVVKVDLAQRKVVGSAAVPSAPVQLYLTPDETQVVSADQGTKDNPGHTLTPVRLALVRLALARRASFRLAPVRSASVRLAPMSWVAIALVLVKFAPARLARSSTALPRFVPGKSHTHSTRPQPRIRPPTRRIPAYPRVISHSHPCEFEKSVARTYHGPAVP